MFCLFTSSPSHQIWCTGYALYFPRLSIRHQRLSAIWSHYRENLHLSWCLVSWDIIPLPLFRCRFFPYAAPCSRACFWWSHAYLHYWPFYISFHAWDPCTRSHAYASCHAYNSWPFSCPGSSSTAHTHQSSASLSSAVSHRCHTPFSVSPII